MTTEPTRPPVADLRMPVELTRRAERKPAPPRRRLWALLAALGLVLVIAEGIWLSKDFWLGQPAVRMALTPVLDRAGYTLERPRLRDAWGVSGLNLSAEAGTGDRVLHLDAVLVNRAAILQPWPVLEVTLRDWQGRLAGRRQLAPAEYLPAGLPADLGPDALVASDRPLRIRVSVQLPLREDGRAAPVEHAEMRPLP